MSSERKGYHNKSAEWLRDSSSARVLVEFGQYNLNDWKKRTYEYLKFGVTVYEANFPIYLQLFGVGDTLSMKRIIVDTAHPSYLFKTKREWPQDVFHRSDIPLNLAVYLSGAGALQLKLDYIQSLLHDPRYESGWQFLGHLERLGVSNESNTAVKESRELGRRDLDEDK